MKLYWEAEKFIVNNPRQGSLNTRIFEAARAKKVTSDPRHLYALVISTLQYKPFIMEILKKSKMLKVETKVKISETMGMLLVHDLLFSKSGRIQSGKHPIKDAVLRHKTRLQAELTKLKLKHKVRDLSELIEEDDTPVRWFRANLCKTTREKILKEFGHLDQVSSFEELEVGKIYHDEYIPNLFGVHPKEKIVSSDAYLNGRIIIQDRASCFPAHILHPSPGDKVIDACAAPGNKTTHLASYLNNIQGSITAFEKNESRSKTLKMMSEKAGALGCITVNVGDFTASNPEDFPDVTGFVVDPSCSGSGIFGRAFDEDSKTDDAVDEERLAKLSGFQFTIVRHAMSFPSAKRLVYSTCSIHAQENERVVVDLLNDPQVKSRGWRLCSRQKIIPDWKRRGFVEEFSSFEDPEAMAGGCVRSLPKVDGGIGFFAAAFERTDESISQVSVPLEGSEVSKEDEVSEEWTGFSD
ncbi:unnamed protein product [Kuraishia capsulata CBS 1993]|uniref:SAM-dependent MTase RsmB/NOP-type domain-containing protein n=1 Tax=Kuraishia capsulata CBS 1993 TaxID=1382522 RepID=W6MXT4_9ASCO|nr:uncharacterized protein KUCA_T00005428001 [Kuraishia capsulata CBS 1993]CDK29440.1 unnamed protein product [Kuraishia capsulata CBS 1993]